MRQNIAWWSSPSTALQHLALAVALLNANGSAKRIMYYHQRIDAQNSDNANIESTLVDGRNYSAINSGWGFLSQARSDAHSPNFVPVTRSRSEWHALQDMFDVTSHEDLGKGRDASGWRGGRYTDMQIVSAWRVEYTSRTQYDVEKARMAQELAKMPRATSQACTCWHAQARAYGCYGYEQMGYQCINGWCAGCNPGGTPHMCAQMQPRGTLPNPSTGRCELTRSMRSGFDTTNPMPGLQVRKSARLRKILNQKRGASALNPKLNEQLLLHGTKDASVLRVARSGLKDMNLDMNGECPKSCRGNHTYLGPCHKNAFGCGVYLADEPEKIDQYAAIRLHNGDYSLIDSLTENQPFVRQFLKAYQSNVFYGFVVKALLGRAAIVNRKVGHYHHYSSVDPRSHPPVKRGFYIDGPNQYHSQYMPSRKVDSDGWFDRFNEVTAPADGSRTQLLYLVAYTRCQAKDAWVDSRGAWTCSNARRAAHLDQ